LIYNFCFAITVSPKCMTAAIIIQCKFKIGSIEVGVSVQAPSQIMTIASWRK
jgi:hypothetical protein